MPLYEVYYVAPLKPTQQDELAHAITRIHSSLFGTASLIVNVKFIEAAGEAYYVAGKKARVNRVIAHVRHNDSRTEKQYNALTKAISDAWTRIIGGVDLSMSNIRDEKTGELNEDTKKKLKEIPEWHQLNTVFIVGGLISSYEKGFNVPPAGQDKAWLKANIEEFKHRAAAGDEDFADLLEELKIREDFKGILPEDECNTEEVKKAKEARTVVPESNFTEEIRASTAAMQFRDLNKSLAEAKIAAENSGFGQRIGSMFGSGSS